MPDPIPNQMKSIAEALNAALGDRYAVEREIGAGGMATVFLAEDLKHRRKVALKVLRPELSAILGSERFLQEIEVTAGLQHPNILPLYDSGESRHPPLLRDAVCGRRGLARATDHLNDAGTARET